MLWSLSALCCFVVVIFVVVVVVAAVVVAAVHCCCCRRVGKSGILATLKKHIWPSSVDSRRDLKNAAAAATATSATRIGAIAAL